MIRIILRNLSILIITLFLLPSMLYAFQADLNTWKSVYPNSTLGNSLSCNLCHGSSKTAANATLYGKAVWGTSPISASVISAAGGLDSDGDGSSNSIEINANTNPSDPNSKPAPLPVTDTPPVAKITVAKTTFTVNETATFSGSTSTDDKGISKYEWDLNGDSTIDVTGVTASTTYAAAGSYKVTLKVTDTINQTGSASVTITVSASAPPPVTDAPPVARIAASKTSFNVGEVVNLSGSGSTDDKGISKYEWDFTTNGSIDAAGVNASTSYNTAGTYRVTLKVTDTIGQIGTASVNITVNAAVTPPPSPAPIPPDKGDDSRKKEEERKKKDDEERKKREDERKKKEDDERKRKK